MWMCECQDTTANVKSVKRVQSNNAVEVIIVSNFLPHELADYWRGQLLQKWEMLDTANPNRSDSYFLYATNEQNAKSRSLHEVEKRRSKAWNKKLSGQFAYGKWELNPADDVIFQIREYMLRNETIYFIAELLGLNPEVEKINTQELSDLFVTHYSPGDFLSSHNDFYSGVFAFVVSLTAGLEGDDSWSKEKYGGELALFCDDSPAAIPFPHVCHNIAPVFNQLVLFRTRPGPFHSVEPVEEEGYRMGFRRLAFTGWYMEQTVTFTDQELKQRDDMRGYDAEVDTGGSGGVSRILKDKERKKKKKKKKARKRRNMNAFGDL
jgi:Rps23 Pro-64 3,4-dihydroxylase Tpa1-like proline 4-hydroxylase